MSTSIGSYEVVRTVANTILGRRIMQARRRLQLSKDVLAKHAGLKSKFVDRLEIGVLQKLDMFDVASIAEVLGFTVDELIKGIPRTKAELDAQLREQRPETVSSLRNGDIPISEEYDDPDLPRLGIRACQSVKYFKPWWTKG